MDEEKIGKELDAVSSDDFYLCDLVEFCDLSSK
jgi:hypothetical protein